MNWTVDLEKRYTPNQFHTTFQSWITQVESNELSPEMTSGPLRKESKQEKGDKDGVGGEMRKMEEWRWR